MDLMKSQVLPASETEKLSVWGDAILRAIRDAVLEEAERHRRLGLPMVTSKDGKVVWIPPDELPRAEPVTERCE
jgi:hypothetical protein